MKDTDKYYKIINVSEENIKKRGLINPKSRLPYNPKLTERAKLLRKNMTKAEKHLWFNCLRKSEYRFLRQRPIDNYIVDFYCPKFRLAIEIDGEIHENRETKEYDKNRTLVLQEYGIYVLRFTNDDIMQNLPESCIRINKYLEKNC